MEGNETPEVVIVEQAAAVVEERKMSEQTRLELEAGREALKKHARSAAAEKGE